jgi:hypothetical protein
MNLPNGENAQIPIEKIANYLLNTEHPQNKGKAFFYLKIGFDQDTPETLKDAILKIAKTGIVQNTETNPEGVKYEVLGDLEAPNGKNYPLKTIWIQENNKEYSRLVTAYPNK